GDDEPRLGGPRHQSFTSSPHIRIFPAGRRGRKLAMSPPNVTFVSQPPGHPSGDLIETGRSPPALPDFFGIRRGSPAAPPAADNLPDFSAGFPVRRHRPRRPDQPSRHGVYRHHGSDPNGSPVRL